MSHRVEYQVVSADDSRDLTTRVNRLLVQGWELHGPPFCNHEALFQALVLADPAGKRMRKTSDD